MEKLSPLRDEVARLHQENARLEQELVEATETQRNTNATHPSSVSSCPLCGAVVEGGDQLQLHYLTGCSAYDHGLLGVVLSFIACNSNCTVCPTSCHRLTNSTSSKNGGCARAQVLQKRPFPMPPPTLGGNNWWEGLPPGPNTDHEVQSHSG